MNIKIIGTVENGYPDRKSAPKQGYYDDRHFILNIDEKYKEACTNLKKGDIIQVIYYADKSDDTALRTIPPYADVKIGVFSTRSPHRPNPILIDIARVLDVNDNKITVEGLDALDGSPILDIKGYSRKLHDNLMQKYIHELI